MRQLAKFEESKVELADLDVTVYAVSVDTQEQAQEVADTGLSFPILYGATQEHSDALDAWWSDRRGGFIQPSEFILGRGGVVLGSMYASGQVGRIEVDEAIRFITDRETRRKESGGE